jgi:hypothetical protein
MSEPTVAPAQDAAAAASTTDLPGDAIDPSYFVPQATRDNYAQIIRDQALLRGMEFAAVAVEYAEQWRRLHELQPLDGYDHLAAWVETFDPGQDAGPTGLQQLQARALESARRDPYQAVIGDQANVAQAVAVQQQADAVAAGAAGSPSVDPATGVLPNAGPVAPPADVVDPESGVVAQAQQPADAPTGGDTSTSPSSSSSSSSGSSSGDSGDTSGSKTTSSKTSSSS